MNPLIPGLLDLGADFQLHAEPSHSTKLVEEPNTERRSPVAASLQMTFPFEAEVFELVSDMLPTQ